jgi:predicted AAA+ superfamily ATPase
MIHRALEAIIRERLFKGKALLLFGPRQSGKSTLVHTMLEGKEYLHFSGDDGYVRETLSNISTNNLRAIIGQHKILFIDEAQRINNIGLTLKLVTERMCR